MRCAAQHLRRQDAGGIDDCQRHAAQRIDDARGRAVRHGRHRPSQQEDPRRLIQRRNVEHGDPRQSGKVLDHRATGDDHRYRVREKSTRGEGDCHEGDVVEPLGVIDREEERGRLACGEHGIEERGRRRVRWAAQHSQDDSQTGCRDPRLHFHGGDADDAESSSFSPSGRLVQQSRLPQARLGHDPQGARSTHLSLVQAGVQGSEFGVTANEHSTRVARRWGWPSV